MPLLIPNTPFTDVVALNALKIVIVPNTQLAAGSSDGTGLGQVYINNYYAMLQGSFPAVHLSSAAQQYKACSRATYNGKADLLVQYFDRWDSQQGTQGTLDAIFAGVSQDILRIQANIESNDRLVVGGQQALQTITRILLSPYYSELDTSFSGFILVTRMLILSCILPEYDA